MALWNGTLDENRVLLLIKNDPKITQQEISDATGLSLRTVKRIISKLQSENVLTRINGRRYGEWLINVSLKDI